MRKVRYMTVVPPMVTEIPFEKFHTDKQLALNQAVTLRDSYHVMAYVYEIVTDGEDIVSNKKIFDGGDD